MEVFKETQTFRHLWVSWLICSPILGASIWGLYENILHVENWGPTNTQLIIVSITGCFLGLIFLTVSLTTEIDDSGISINWRPFFIKRNFSWDQIQSIDIRQFDGLYEFGGFGNDVGGIRFGRNGLTGYFVTGGTGIFIKTIDDKKILIGTRMPRSVSEVIDKLVERGIIVR